MNIDPTALSLITGAGGIALGAYADTLKHMANYAGGNAMRVISEMQYERKLIEAKEANDAKDIESHAPSPSVAIPILEGATLETREELIKLWTALLAAAMNPNKSKRVSRYFTEALKKLEPLDALLLEVMSNSSGSLEQNRKYNLMQAYSLTLSEIEVSILNLLEIGLIRSIDLVPQNTISLEQLRFTARGTELVRLLEI